MANTVRAKGATGFRGVVILEGKFAAMIRHNNKTLYLGSYSTAEEAHRVWCKKAIELRGAFARFD